MLAGFLLTPNALAAADVSAQAKKFMVVMNAATSIIITKSPYMIRTSVTLPQVMETFGTWAAKSGIKKCYTMVTDYGPGHDFEAAFQRAFKEAGGEIVGSVRFPVANPDFSAFVQRAKDMNLECIYIFIPGGAQPAALGKAFAERGIDPNKTKILGSGETTSEQALKSMGDAGLGIISAWHYDYKSDAPRNVEFVKVFNEMHGRNPDFFSIGGYDGMHVIYETLKKTGGKTDGESPDRGRQGPDSGTARAARCRSIRRRATWCRRSISGGCRRSAANSSMSRSTRSRTSRIRRGRAAGRRLGASEFARRRGRAVISRCREARRKSLRRGRARRG